MRRRHHGVDGVVGNDGGRRGELFTDGDERLEDLQVISGDGGAVVMQTPDHVIGHHLELVDERRIVVVKRKLEEQ